MARYQFSEEEGNYRIDAEVICFGGDGCVWIYGGDEPHIGAVSVGGPDSLEQDVVFEGHREDTIVQHFRKELLEKNLLKHCVVCCGIHYNEIDKKGIDMLITLSWRLCGRVCRGLEGNKVSR